MVKSNLIIAGSNFIFSHIKDDYFDYIKKKNKCGSRLQKRNDRRSDWGSNLKDTTATKDDREAFLKKLRKLGELKDKGMLSDEEFQVAKASLLK